MKLGVSSSMGDSSDFPVISAAIAELTGLRRRAKIECNPDDAARIGAAIRVLIDPPPSYREEADTWTEFVAAKEAKP